MSNNPFRDIKTTSQTLMDEPHFFQDEALFFIHPKFTKRFFAVSNSDLAAQTHTHTHTHTLGFLVSSSETYRVKRRHKGLCRSSSSSVIHRQTFSLRAAINLSFLPTRNRALMTIAKMCIEVVFRNSD